MKDHDDTETVGLDADNDPIKLQQSLDASSPVNGYNPNGNSNYSPAFLKRYTKAQADRMNDWIDQALRMPLEERRIRHQAMLSVMRRNSLERWRDRFVADLRGAVTRRRSDA